MFYYHLSLRFLKYFHLIYLKRIALLLLLNLTLLYFLYHLYLIDCQIIKISAKHSNLQKYSTLFIYLNSMHPITINLSINQRRNRNKRWDNLFIILIIHKNLNIFLFCKLQDNEAYKTCDFLNFLHLCSSIASWKMER